jgi:endonuclease YncB( thermonuclease family)
MKLIIIMAILLSLTAHAAKVCSVHDGDTLTLCNNTKLRLWGIDAPELKQPLGIEARDYLASLVMGKNVAMYCKDLSHQRLVCSVYYAGANINRKVVLAGLAYDDPEFSKGRFSRSQQTAQAEALGVWQRPGGGQRPWDYRRGGRKPKAEAPAASTP